MGLCSMFSCSNYSKKYKLFRVPKHLKEQRNAYGLIFAKRNVGKKEYMSYL